ncbi:hypothetical protein ANANG_G00232230 [Anguilla anguilla]|uniref:Uncharacterized protein n=1 Tax=Anguilla anguilla TaxID=7936 RepID=A0A9D3LTL1_ANGAN|nr:hypothetical protein ANANG_G00232230 [Anguilla anguilla]
MLRNGMSRYLALRLRILKPPNADTCCPSLVGTNQNICLPKICIIGRSNHCFSSNLELPHLSLAIHNRSSNYFGALCSLNLCPIANCVLLEPKRKFQFPVGKGDFCNRGIKEHSFDVVTFYKCIIRVYKCYNIIIIIRRIIHLFV